MIPLAPPSPGLALVVQILLALSVIVFFLIVSEGFRAFVMVGGGILLLAVSPEAFALVAVTAVVFLALWGIGRQKDPDMLDGRPLYGLDGLYAMDPHHAVEMFKRGELTLAQIAAVMSAQDEEEYGELFDLTHEQIEAIANAPTPR